MNYDVIILGAGAAGLMCGIEAGKRGRSVLIMERSPQIGEKIRISGGGRCNFTNLNTAPEKFYSHNPHFAKSALARFTPKNILRMVERHRIAWHEKKLGQLFCDASSRPIIDMLLKECSQAGAAVRTGCHVEMIGRNGQYTARTNQGVFHCQSLVVATGGLSIPQLGATDFGHRLAKQFELAVIEPRPGLVPLTLDASAKTDFSDLSGVSIDAQVRCGDTEFRENILFTHRGLSGPAILQISCVWNPGDILTIDVSPEVNLDKLFEDHRRNRVELSTLLAGFLPKRFAQKWCSVYAPSKLLNQLSTRELKAIAHKLHHWPIKPSGTEGFAKAEVTLDGVDTRELSSTTMEARKVPGLFFIGEVVDVTGQLGGHNFQWAWASGYAAGQYA